MGFIAAFWSFIYSGEIIYDPPESDLFYDIYNTLKTNIEDKLATFH